MADQFVELESQIDLPVPPFQSAPLPPPQNVLQIPTQPGECGRNFSNAYYLQQAITNYKSGIQFAPGIFGPPLRMRVGKCFAELFGCNVLAYAAAWDEEIYGPKDPVTNRMPENATTLGNTRFDSDPNFDQQQLDGTLDCAAPLIVTELPPPPPPPPPPPVIGPPRKFYPGCCTNKVIV